MQEEKTSVIAYFWDIENCPVPRQQAAFSVVNRVRQHFAPSSNFREVLFSCFCDSASLPAPLAESLSRANVRIIHVPSRKDGAVDRHILLELDRFERAHKPPATIVLISGDIDFIHKLTDLRYHLGYKIAVAHNAQATSELKEVANEAVEWNNFHRLSAQQQPQSVAAFEKKQNPPIGNEAPNIGPVSSKPTKAPKPSTATTKTKSKVVVTDTVDPVVAAPRKVKTKAASAVTDTNAAATVVAAPRKAKAKLAISDTDAAVESAPAPRKVKVKVALSDLTDVPAATPQKYKTKPDTDASVAAAPRRVRKPVNGCSVCQQVFESAHSLEQHMEAKGHFYCSECEQTFGTAQGLLVHQQSKGHSDAPAKPVPKKKTVKTKKPSYVCEACAQEFTGAQGLRDHQRDKHNICPHCERSFASPESMLQHIGDKHESKDEESDVEEEGGAGARDQQNLERRWASDAATTIPASTIIGCNACGQNLRGEKSFKRHWLKFHSDQVFEMWKCTECTSGFYAAQDLYIHLLQANHVTAQSIERVQQRVPTVRYFPPNYHASSSLYPSVDPQLLGVMLSRMNFS